MNSSIELGEKAVLEKSRKTLLFSFSLMILGSIIAVYVKWKEIQLIDDLASGIEVSEALLQFNDYSQILILLMMLILHVFTIVIFLVWISRMHGIVNTANGQSIQARYRAPEIWNYFIPIFQWYKPYMDMQRLNQYVLKYNTQKQVALRQSWVIMAWWFLFLISHFVLVFYLWFVLEQETLEQMKFYNTLAILYYLLLALEAGLVLCISNSLIKRMPLLKRA